MTHFYDKTPILDAGLARSFMCHLLAQVKSHRGLTTFIEHRGVNGRWLKPDQPYNIRVAKFLKIMEIKAHVRHYNQHAIGICYEGGLDEHGRYADTRTEAQKTAILFLLKDLKQDYPKAKVVGHRDFPGVAKECPCLDVAKEYGFLNEGIDD